MNRSLANVLFGAFGGAAPAAAAAADGEAKSYREVTAEDCAVMLAYASRVVVVPGYGLAVAQAQHAVRELADLLEARGVRVQARIVDEPQRRAAFFARFGMQRSPPEIGRAKPAEKAR